MMKPLIIIGSGGLAGEVAWLVEENNKVKKEWNIIGYVTQNTTEDVYRYPVLGDDDYLLNLQTKMYAVIAIGNPMIRSAVADRYCNAANIIFPTIISVHSLVADSASLGHGTIICAGSIISINTRIGDHVICDRNSNIGHGSAISDYVTVSPGVNVSGNVTVGECSMLGTGSSIIQGINIGAGTVLGAGATVITDINEGCTAVGVPAKEIKYNGFKRI